MVHVAGDRSLYYLVYQETRTYRGKIGKSSTLDTYRTRTEPIRCPYKGGDLDN